MKFGKRIKQTATNDITWCEISADEVLNALTDNIDLNATIYEYCAAVARKLANSHVPAGTPHTDIAASAEMIATALFNKAAVAGLTTLQEVLAERTHFYKVHALP